jgi:hypothetical protein
VWINLESHFSDFEAVIRFWHGWCPHNHGIWLFRPWLFDTIERMARKPRWSAPLSRPITVKDGPTLRTLGDARAFMLHQPEGIQLRQSWQRAAGLLLAAADGADVESVTKQIELALLLEARWAFPK